MKIIIAPDSFKESMTAMQAAEAIETGMRLILPDAEYIKVPMADGGEGTVQSLVDATNGKLIHLEVTGPLGEPVQAFFGMMGDGKTAIIEMAAASGLHHVAREQRNPLITTTYGTGELILAALDQGAEKIIMGLGGSATNDGGAGMAQALGAKLLKESGEEISYGGGELNLVDKIDLKQLDSRIRHVEFIAACDVDNPLTGERGASAIFGPQKGATPEMVELLDHNLAHYAVKLTEATGKEVVAQAGAGAAGGMGAAVLAYLNAELKRGVDIVIEAANLAKHMEGADLVITGEGKIDRQTVFGKTPMGVSMTAKVQGIPVIALAGMVAPGSEAVHEIGINALFSIVPGVTTLEEALKDGEANMIRAARNVAMCVKLGMGMKS
ncbi:glycerate kinase [Paenibacillus sp. N1-5-1-14]|uniref:glycerate kinase n=1 Tax=Paenibacillus radicibacter TaxID=2972488 RepID=UPI002159527C|nr:glycerate kinase [Paenibacillus radicibacter]MCR8643173.1 glycerate kinase [Paenibacillus radicibacter]